ncbi:SPFH domain-containing protein [Serratia marcescens]|uniref:SPFH domain-containing protein n=1 Tax=Serratia marcescens TaxID=615 RepID=UPI0029D8237C|nr:SPFH domain-containing protein [Serratia marcescens]MDX7487225.1 SPFH domain-containing protein [Serratia marcescens]
MKKIIMAAVLALSALVLTGCERATVPAGYVGVKVDLYGDTKGVQQQEVGVGKYWLTWNEEIYQFPTFNQLHVYDQPFNFQTKDSMSVSAKVGVEYYVDQSKVSKVFQTYRKGVEEITSVNIRQNIADALIKDSGTMDIGTLAGEGRTQLLDNVTKAVKAKLDPIGIIIVKLSWTDDLKYPQQVTDSINAKIEATQKTLLRENEIAQTKAEAQKTIEAARGEAESNVLRAKAESEAITVKAKAEADAIALRAEALRKNPEVLQLEAIGKWNGELPQYMTSGTSTPFIQVK